MAAMGVGLSGGVAHLWLSSTADPAGEALLCSGGSAMQPPPATVAPTAVPPTATTVPPTAAPTDPAATAAPTTAPTAVPPTTAPTAAPTGEVLNQAGTIAAGATTEHTFNVATGRTYTVVVSPSATLDADPQYVCTVANGSASGGFDWNWEGVAETFTYTATGDGSCTVTVAGYGGTTGTYTITATAR
jgi:hypothetical protein